jgi:hypothetical protein
MTHKREPAEPSPYELEIRPEPPAPVRRAIEQAVGLANEAAEAGAWWRAGVEESVARDDV